MHPSELLHCAAEAALRAGALLRRGFGSSFEVSSKPGRHNLVTEYDRAAEKLIIGDLLKRFPDHQILAEESGASPKRPGKITWIIDPLDGTVNFAHGIPVFSVSIGALFEGEVIAGVVYQPITQELFLVAKGHGASCNGAPLHVSTTAKIDDAFVSTGFPYNAEENPLSCVETFSHMTRLGIPIRRLGSAAIDLAYVAAGRFDVHWEVTLYPWDCAAGQLMVEEAGGKVTDYQGAPRDRLGSGPLLATNGLLHARMVKELIP
jgi:myo-inositol-1(or 4)-monophosphatase